MILAAMILVGTGLGVAYNEYRLRQGLKWLEFDDAACRKAMAAVGDVSLDGKNYAQLLELFGPPAHVRVPTAESTVRNQVAVFWWGDTIQADYVATSPPNGVEMAIRLYVRRYFRGSLGGVHLGDTKASFLATQRAGSPIETTTYPEGSRSRRYSTWVDVSGEVHMTRWGDPWWTMCVAKDDRIVSIEQWDSRVKVIPIEWR